MDEATDEARLALSEPGGTWTVPLARMSCALGAAFDPATGTIACAGAAGGFAMYGPYAPVEPGVYAVEVDVALAGGKNPKLDLDLWIEGRVLDKRAVLLERARVTLRGWVDTPSRLEVRAHTAGTAFAVHAIRVRRLDPAALAAEPGAAERAARKHRLRAAIGFSDEPPADGAPPAADLLDAILADPGFLLVEDTAIPAHAAALRRGGIDPVAVQLLFARNNGRLVQGPGDPRGLMTGYPDVTNAFQLDILRDGALTIPSPFGPGTMASTASFPVASPLHGLPHLFYEFCAPHHVIVAANSSWLGALSFVWFVDHDVLVYDARLHSIADYEATLPVVRGFVELCARHRPLARAYRAAEKSVACLGGFIGNMGHYFWNEVSGLERVRRAGHRPPLLLAAPRWLALRDIFRDDFAVAAEVEPGRDALFTTALARNLLLVRPTGNALDADLAAKVARAAGGVLEADRPGRGAEIAGLADGAFVLFFNLRAHNKAWVEQVEGAVAAVARLRARLGSRPIVVFLDGYRDCAGIAAEIRGRLGAEQAIPARHVVDGTDAAFAETLVWAYRCDLFVAVIGSGLVPLTWLAAKPGVCHGDHLHLAQMSFWLRVRPGYDRLAWPRHDQVRNTEDVYYSNYSVSPDLIADLAVSQFTKATGGGSDHGL